MCNKTQDFRQRLGEHAAGRASDTSRTACASSCISVLCVYSVVLSVISEATLASLTLPVRLLAICVVGVALVGAMSVFWVADERRMRVDRGKADALLRNTSNGDRHPAEPV